ncbi:MAG: hypothetical protein MZV63_23430 [Marinilabiliales bacterium]|nr:hypothetical protein [Marinilabiliales bacterium]
MSKKKETGKAIENVEQTLTKTEQFLEQNYKPLSVRTYRYCCPGGSLLAAEDVYREEE